MTARLARRILIVSATTVAAAVALAGCYLIPMPDQSSAPHRSPMPITDGVAPDLLPFYQQTLDWTDCGGDFDCTTVTAPLDWSDPEAGTIDLSVIRHAATDSDPLGSLLTNPGGPGASGVDLVRDSLDYAVGQALQENYDVIGFDPRGVGESTAVTCLDAAGMDSFVFDIPPGQRRSAEWDAFVTEQQKTFAAACEQNSDGILPFITTENAAQDMDLLRAVLGDEKLNYLGYSYGTFLGATYAKHYPDRVGRLVLDGAIDPSLSGLDVSTQQAIGFENALRAYMASCVGQSDCPFNGSVDEAMGDLAILLASVDRDPIRNSDGRMLGADSLVTAIVTALYAQESWPYLTQALTDALQGEASTAFSLADFYYNRQDGQYLDNSTEAFLTYNCMDYPADETDAEHAASQAAIAQQAPTIAPYWESVNLCDVWPYAPTGVREPITAAGAEPIVVIGTTGDPATPYDWSVALADQLESGVLITRVGEGHTGYNKGNVCVDDAVEAYFIDGIVPPDGLVCQ
ncbi:alpha/beta hydrolase [Microbacterium schleiferi]|uniref:Alpha/beta hydrolase n=1 Tax=Microbacterium schleiferi TaxID=69362 RepID=A0ABU7V719_9MICO